jgi:hypothetical protein
MPIICFKKTLKEYQDLVSLLAWLTQHGVTYDIVDNQQHVQVIMTGGF